MKSPEASNAAFDPERSPGMTDLMIPPEVIDAYLAENPPTAATLCHVYVVTRHVIAPNQPEGECSACGCPLAEHEKRTSSLVPRNQAYIIDERRLDV